MSADLAGIVYGSASLELRRVIIPDDDVQLDSVQLAAGESLLKVARAQGALTDDETRQLIATLANVQVGSIGNSRCAVVDPTGLVTGVITADPAIDSVEGSTLIASDLANIGDSFVAGVLVPQVQPTPTP